VKRLLLAAMIAGCAPARPIDLPTAASAQPRTTFILYHGSVAVTVDSLRLVDDTVHARALPTRPGGPRDAIVLPRAAVDSIRRAHPDRSALTLAAFPFAIAIGLVVLFRASYGSD
jgi:hypothetical protein